ncbi:MAG: hypothetical protein V4850_14660 [Myxococcota bacterium]
MTPEPVELGLLVFLLNTALLTLVVWVLGRGATANPKLATAALAALFYFDACALVWTDCGLFPLGMLAIGFTFAGVMLPESFTRPMTQALGRDRLALFLVSVFTLAALVYIYLPITTFLTSPGELDIHLEFLLTHNAGRTITVLYAGAAIYGMALFSRMKTVLSFAALTALLVAVVYAFVLPFGYPMMNGLLFEQIPVTGVQLAARSLVDATVAPLVTLGALAALLRFGARGVVVALVLLNVSFGTVAAARALQEREGSRGGGDATSGSAQPIRFSKADNNVLLLFLDRFMGGFVEEILVAEPALAQRLDGFTWYPRTLAAGENSIAGLHPLLGGYDYTPDEMNRAGRPLRDQSVESFAILPYNFTAKGYEAHLVNPHGLGFTMEGDCSFLSIEGLECASMPASLVADAAAATGVPVAELSKASYSDLLVLLGVMRSAPYLVKAAVGELGPWREFLDHSAATTLKQWAELEALPALTRTDAPTGSLNIVMNMLPHEPYFMGEDCRPRRTRLVLPDEEVAARGYASLFDLQHAVAARCTLLLVADYVDWMKKEGVYDNTKVVLVSDHGIVGPVEDRSSRAIAGGTQSRDFVRFRSLLMVKPRGARGVMATSEEFLPNAEVPRILCEEIGGCVNPYLNGKPIEALGRNDPFYVSLVPWQFNLQSPDAFRIDEQMVLTGKDPYDVTGWRRSE